MKNERLVLGLSVVSALYFLIYFSLYYSGLAQPKFILVLQELLTLVFLVIAAACFVVSLVNVFRQGFRLRSRYFYALLISAVVLGIILGVTLMEEDLIDF
jgi:hypothetical protein